MNKIGLLWRTVRYLKTRQILYQLWNRLRQRPKLRLQNHVPITYFLTVPKADKPVSWQDGTFTFLNQRVTFPQQINWNYYENGKLWTYNLNYFDFLNQPGLLPNVGLKLMRDFIVQTDSLRDGLEPYPTSLRIGNWVQFLSRHAIQDDRINAHLFAQTKLLSHRLEYHLAGNHLLENGFALLVGARYFRHKRWLQMGAELIRTELTTQILADGSHVERSPMYHQLLLDRLLNVLLILKYDDWYIDTSLIAFLTQKAVQMLAWIEAVTFRNGAIPLVNDAAFGVAPTTLQLRQKASQLISLFSCGKQSTDAERRLRTKSTPGRMSGYRMFRQNRYELLADVGSIGPNYQPGHGHADTFSFVLYVDKQPVIVDSGTSTYQVGQRRMWERSTAAHNTIEVATTNSSEAWAGFRVGRRAQVMVLRDTATALTARHTGYQHLGIVHQRSWSTEPTKLTIVDRLLHVRNERLSDQKSTARFYFHSGVEVRVSGDVVTAGLVQLTFNSVTKLTFHVTKCTIAEEFNQLQLTQCLEVAFTTNLETTITLLNEDTVSDFLLRT